MKNTLALAVLVALGAPGCYLDLGGDPPPSPSPNPWPNAGTDAAVWDGGAPDSGWDFDAPAWNAPGENSLAVEGVTLNGSVGVVSSDADAEFYVFESSSRGDFTSIDIRARNESGVLMNRLEIANFQNLQIGETYQSDATTRGPSVFVSVIGCSGPEDNQWGTDTGSEEVTLDVREGPEEGSAEIFYTASFRNGDVVQGSFVMPLDP